jgi:hypothetical protein
MRSLPPLPKTGHPRMFFTDAERAEHRNRLENTGAGKVAKKVLDCYVACLKGTLDRDADYLKPDISKGRWGTHGFMPLFRYGDQSGEGYRNYSQGKAEGTLNLGGLALEAYRCWVWEDTEGAKLAAKALETYLRDNIAKTEKGKRPHADFNVAFCYDFLFNAMTSEQRKLVHSVLLLGNYDNNQYGCFQDPVQSTSNWTTFSYRIFSWLPLDGDEGFNDLMYRGYVRGMHNFLTYGWFKRGPCWEGMGKNQLGGEVAYVMARRGDNVVAHPHLLANVREYMPHAILPWGGEYIAYDRLGGPRLLNYSDMLPIKYLFPEDRRIDWVYRNTVYDDYSFTHRNVHCEFHPDNVRVQGWGNNAMMIALFLTDYIKDNNDPEKLGLEESFFGAQRGLMITRSDWGKDAACLHHHCRGASGGHVFADRNNIVLAGKGRVWIQNGSHSYKTHQNNVVTIDDWEQWNNSPGRMVDYKRSELATFSCGDAKPAYEWGYKGAGGWGQYTLADAEQGKIEIPEGWERNTTTFNDFAYEQDPAPHFTMEYFLRPDWLKPGTIQASVRKARPENAVQKAFRTAGLVRGRYPYALVMDDIAASDGKEHRFVWNARVPTDLVLTTVRSYWLNTDGTPVPKNKTGDRKITELTLMGAGALTKLDQYGGYAPPRDTPGCKIVFVQMDGTQDQTTQPRIEVEGGRILRLGVVGEDPKFKAILYPYVHGRSPHPTLSFTTDGDLVVEIGNQKDVVNFKEGQDGRTGLKLTRETPDGPQAFTFGL